MLRSFSIRQRVYAAFCLPIIALGVVAGAGVSASIGASAEAQSEIEALEAVNVLASAAMAIADERLSHLAVDNSLVEGEQAIEEAVAASDAAMELVASKTDGVTVDRVWNALGAARSTPVGRAANFGRAVDLLLVRSREVVGQGSRSDRAVTGYDQLHEMYRFVDAEDVAWQSFLDRTSDDVRSIATVVEAFAQSAAVHDRLAEWGIVDPDGPAARSLRATEVVEDLRATAIEDLLNTDQALVSATVVFGTQADARQRWQAAADDQTAIVGSRLTARALAAENQRNQFGLFGLLGVLILGAIAVAVAQSIGDPIAAANAEAKHLLDEQFERISADVASDGTMSAPQLLTVSADDEVGELVGTLNSMQVKLVDIASRENIARRHMSARYTTLSGRTTALLHDLVRHVAQWRAADPSPEVAQRLFHIDHIATRIQRNVEASLVVGGGRSERRWTTPISVVNTARLALGEITEFDRVDVKPMDEVRIHGLVAPDVAHVLAEVIDNGLAASASADSARNRVVVEGEWISAGWAFLVHDSGEGTTPEQRQRLNTDLHTPSMAQVGPTDKLGFFLVGRCAARFGLDVRLLERPTGGTTVRIVLPVDLLDPETVPNDRKRIDAGRGVANGIDPNDGLSAVAPKQTAVADAFFGDGREAVEESQDPTRGGETSPLGTEHDVDAELAQLTESKIPLPMRAVDRTASALSTQQT